MTISSPFGDVSVGAYLATRLRQLGVDHLFGLPGDFNLTLIDEMLAAGNADLTWVGSTNELNASYAADGYARAHRGIGAVVTTLGVGELSAINGVAGAYAEDVPVIAITGTAPSDKIAAGAPLHHTLLDGDYDRFVRQFAEVTAAAELISVDTAAATIDRVLTAAVTTSKPVYLAIPADVAAATIDGTRLGVPIMREPSDPFVLHEFEAALRAAIRDAGSLTILAGAQVHRRCLEESVRGLAEIPGVLIATQPGAKALLDEDHPRSLGSYVGAISPSPEARRAVDEAERLIMIGAPVSDLLTGFFSNEFDPADAIALNLRSARIGSRLFDAIDLEDTLEVLAAVAREQERTDRSALMEPTFAAVSDAADDAPLTQKSFWGTIQQWMPAGTFSLADAGTAFYGALELRMPPHSDLMGQPIWSSIGYTVPAALGAAIAAPGKQIVLFVGDGAAQLTVQELATIMHRGLTPIVFIVNNSGYTIEREIQSPDAVYQDVTAWNWSALPSAFAPDVPVVVEKVTTVASLTKALEAVDANPGVFRLVDVVLPADDAPALLRNIATRLAHPKGTDGAQSSAEPSKPMSQVSPN